MSFVAWAISPDISTRSVGLRINSKLYYEEHNTFQSLGCEVLTEVVTDTFIFCDITPCSPLKAKWRFGVTYLHLQRQKIIPSRNQHAALLGNCFVLVSHSADSPTLKKVMACSFETSIDFQRTIQHLSEKTNINCYFTFHNICMYINYVFDIFKISWGWKWFCGTYYNFCSSTI
jgi:hypothetical protein